jgi:hypothetical protein
MTADALQRNAAFFRAQLQSRPCRWRGSWSLPASR